MLSENKMDHVGIFVVVVVGKFLFVVMLYSGSLKEFWPVADCNYEHPQHFRLAESCV